MTDWKNRKDLVAILVTIIFAPILITLILYMSATFYSGKSVLPIEAVTGFLTFDGIMIAAIAFLAQLLQEGGTKTLRKPILAVVLEFVISSGCFLFSLQGIQSTQIGFEVTIGSFATVGTAFTIAGLVSLVVLISGQFID